MPEDDGPSVCTGGASARGDCCRYHPKYTAAHNKTNSTNCIKGCENAAAEEKTECLHEEMADGSELGPAFRTHCESAVPEREYDHLGMPDDS